MNNFPFEHEGKKYWYSRSVACVSLIMSFDPDNNPVILAVKRGTGASSHQGQWCLPGGYLDHNETCQECAERELHEETGIDYHFMYHLRPEIMDNPTWNKKQDIVFIYKTIDMYLYTRKLTTEFSEPDEVEEIRWIPVSDFRKYDWAFSYVDWIELLINKMLSNVY